MQNEAGGPQFELQSQPEINRQGAEQADGAAIEKQRPAAQESAVGKRPPQPADTSWQDLSQVPQMPVVIPSEPTAQPSPQGPISPATSDLGAAEADLIEKDWVSRAKSVVSQTRDDPHRQKNEMSKIKADYIHKRFKKIIKTEGDSFNPTQSRPEQGRMDEAAA